MRSELSDEEVRVLDVSVVANPTDPRAKFGNLLRECPVCGASCLDVRKHCAFHADSSGGLRREDHLAALVHES